MGINEIINIGEAIKNMRKKRNIRQKEMAAELGIPVSTYSNYENGKRDPSLKILQDIAKIFDMSLDDLLFLCIDINKWEKSKTIEMINIYENLLWNSGFQPEISAISDDYIVKYKGNEYSIPITEFRNLADNTRAYAIFLLTNYLDGIYPND